MVLFNVLVICLDATNFIVLNAIGIAKIVFVFKHHSESLVSK